MTVLHEHYRPRVLDDVVGQAAATRALAGVIKQQSSRAFIFSGPSGIGKTTLARIAAGMMGCVAENIIEIDAATNTGIDAMRQVQELTQYRPFGKSKWRALIVDECHALSRQAWQSLLKVIEEPPEFVAWFFCTTEATKVPPTIKTRCTSVVLRPVADADLRKLLARVVSAEGMRIDREVQEVVIREAGGSPRQMLVNLALCREARGRKEASELLRAAQESDGVAELCKFLLKGGSWARATALLSDLEGDGPEAIRIAVCNYLGGALKRARSDREACAVMELIEPFSAPFPAGAERVMLHLAVGRVLFGGGE